MDDGTATMDRAYSVAAHFRLHPAEARKIAGEVARPVKQWRKAAERMGLRKNETDRMASAFESPSIQ